MNFTFNIVFAMLMASHLALAADENNDAAVISLVAQHRSGAPDKDNELKLVAELEAIGARTADAWRPHFWAAYFLTQIAMSHQDDRGNRLDRAQKNLDESTHRAKEGNEYEPASHLSLQALIYRFRMSSETDDDALDKLRIRVAETEQLAFDANPDNPVAMVMAATNIIRLGQQERSWQQIMGGHALLKTAQSQFMDDDRPKGLTTHFNSEWVRPWLNWVDRLYAGGFDAE